MAHEFWVPTKLDAWLARNFTFFAKRWRRRWACALQEEAYDRLEGTRQDVNEAAHRFIFAPTEEMRQHYHEKLLDACCRDRNALSHFVRETHGQDAANSLAQGWVDAMKPPADPESH